MILQLCLFKRTHWGKKINLYNSLLKKAPSVKCEEDKHLKCEIRQPTVKLSPTTKQSNTGY